MVCNRVWFLRELRECMNIFNDIFYRYGGHIELIRFNEYYGMPREHQHDPFSRLVSSFYGPSLYISREKGDHYYIQIRHNDLFSDYNLIIGKL